MRSPVATRTRCGRSDHSSCRMQRPDSTDLPILGTVWTCALRWSAEFASAGRSASGVRANSRNGPRRGLRYTPNRSKDPRADWNDRSTKVSRRSSADWSLAVPSPPSGQDFGVACRSVRLVVIDWLGSLLFGGAAPRGLAVRVGRRSEASVAVPAVNDDAHVCLSPGLCPLMPSLAWFGSSVAKLATLRATAFGLRSSILLRHPDGTLGPRVLQRQSDHSQISAVMRPVDRPPWPADRSRRSAIRTRRRIDRRVVLDSARRRFDRRTSARPGRESSPAGRFP
jgi:hypothetical protein